MEPTYLVLAFLAAIVAALVVYFFRKPRPPQLDTATNKQLSEKKPSTAEARATAVSGKPGAPKAEKGVSPKPERVAPPSPPAREAEEVENKPVSMGQAVPRETAPIAETKTVAQPASSSSRTEPATRRRDVEGLRKGLAKVREKEGFFGRLRALFSERKEIDPQLLEHIEEVLLACDVGVKTTSALVEAMKQSLPKDEFGNADRVWQVLREQTTSVLNFGGGSISVSAKPTVVMFVGVNGVGKTTTIGKLATKLKAEGKSVVLAAGDTFRAAAVQQLKVWGKRIDVEVVAGKDGANPGAVIFDAIQRAKEVRADVVLVDTAGRLHTKTNLMDELTKVSRTMAKALEGAPHETLLVLDATNGQNAMQQAALFKESLPLTGLVLTKLDGTAKGGVILGVCAEHQLPVRYVGIGERAEDLRDFVAEEFVEAMLGQGDNAEAA